MVIKVKLKNLNNPKRPYLEDKNKNKQLFTSKYQLYFIYKNIYKYRKKCYILLKPKYKRYKLCKY